MMIRRLSPADLEACRSIADDRGWTTPATHWEQLLRYGIAYGTEEHDRLNGTVIAFPHEGLTFIGMMLVRSNVEGRGLGRMLMEHALTNSPGPTALIATELGRPLYEKLGFVAREEITIHEGVWSSSKEGSATVYDPRALSKPRIDALVDADERAFGYRRPRLLAAMCDLAERIAVLEAGAACWYAMASRNGDALEIGPIVAPNAAIALALVSSLAAPGDRVRVRAVASRDLLRRGLTERGLVDVGRRPYMTLGDVRMPNLAWCAIALMSTG